MHVVMLSEARAIVKYRLPVVGWRSLHSLNGAGEGNRTPASSLEGWSSTTELHPHGMNSLNLNSKMRDPMYNMVGPLGLEPRTNRL
jgi:hypothetical protein